MTNKNINQHQAFTVDDCLAEGPVVRTLFQNSLTEEYGELLTSSLQFP